MINRRELVFAQRRPPPGPVEVGLTPVRGPR